MTEGLYYEMGLHSKFFQYSESIFTSKFNLELLNECLNDKHFLEPLIFGGDRIHLDTSQILSSVELESLTSEEIEEVRSSLNNYDCYVQLKKLPIHP